MFRYIISIITLTYIALILLMPVSSADEQVTNESSMSIYSGGEKVGFSKTLIEDHDGNVLVNEKSEIRVNLLGKNQNVKTDADYALRGFYLDSFKFKMDSDTAKLSAWGGINDNELKIKLKTRSGETDLVLDAKEPYTVFSILPKLLSQKPMAVGEEYEILLFEPSAVLMGVDQKDLVSINRVQDEEIIQTELGASANTFRVVTEFMGASYTSWITPKGDVLKQTLPPGLTATKDKELSQEPGRLSSLDIMEKTSIESNKKIKNPRDLKFLRVEIRGIDNTDGMSIDGGRQDYKDGIIEINIEDSISSSYEIPYTGQEEEEYLEPSYLIQSSDPKILALARKIAGSESDPKLAASKIYNWMYKNIKKEGTVSLPNALDVLETKKGDCNEHAALFAALSRALGIPTKVVMGTIYIDGRFYYHAWNEVFLGEWTAVDSTYGQLPADASHIKLIEGDLKKSGEIMKLVGKIKIEVLEAS